MNGENWVVGLNIEKQFGVITAMSLEKEILIKNGEGLMIGFTPVSGNTILNGVRIKKYSS